MHRRDSVLKCIFSSWEATQKQVICDSDSGASISTTFNVHEWKKKVTWFHSVVLFSLLLFPSLALCSQPRAWWVVINGEELNHSKRTTKNKAPPLYGTRRRALHQKQGALDVPAPVCVHLNREVDLTVSLTAFQQAPGINMTSPDGHILTLLPHKRAFTWVTPSLFQVIASIWSHN